MLSNGYNNWLGTACLRGVPMCVLLWQSICMCACRFINDCTCEFILCACRVACHSLHVSPNPLVFVQCNICFCLCSSSYQFFVSDQQSAADIFFRLLWLMREKETWRNSTDKSGKAWVIFCDAFPTKPPTTPRMPWQPLHLLINDFCYCRPSCLWSFNKVCFYFQRTGGTHSSDSWHVCCSTANNTE